MFHSSTFSGLNGPRYLTSRTGPPRSLTLSLQFNGSEAGLTSVSAWDAKHWTSEALGYSSSIPLRCKSTQLLKSTEPPMMRSVESASYKRLSYPFFRLGLMENPDLMLCEAHCKLTHKPYSAHGFLSSAIAKRVASRRCGVFLRHSEEDPLFRMTSAEKSFASRVTERHDVLAAFDSSSSSRNCSTSEMQLCAYSRSS